MPRPDPTDRLPEQIRRLGRVHHVAVIVRDMEPALRFWRDSLGLELGVVEEIDHDRVKIAFLPVGESKIELIETSPRKGAEGPVAFLHPRSCHGVLVELIEAPGGPAWTSLDYERGA